MSEPTASPSRRYRWLRRIAWTLGALALPGNREPLWRVPQLALRGIAVDVNARTVTVGEAQSRGAALRMVCEADGTLEMARLLKTMPGTGTSADGATWTLLTQKISVDRVATPSPRSAGSSSG
jgi:hypothetical protein